MRYDILGRRIPERTNTWKQNISKALDKRYLETCKQCQKNFLCHRYRKGTVKYCSIECRAKGMAGQERPKVQKTKIKYSGIHMWIRRYLKATKCEHCGAKNVKLHRANISGKYLRDLGDWKVLCVPCHSEFDGQVKIPRKENNIIVSLRRQGVSFEEIAKKYGVSRKAISKRYYAIQNR